MIPVLLRQLRWRLLAVAVAALLFYLGDEGLHEHVEDNVSDVADLLAPFGISYSITNLATLAMVVLLAGFISADRRRGYYRLAFSHPTRPLALYGLRWFMALALSMGAAALFWLLAQLAGWGQIVVGPSFLLHALTLTVVYGGVTAFLSAILPRGDGFVAVVLFFATEFWLSLVQEWPTPPFTPAIRAAIAFVLPPHTAASTVYQSLLTGSMAWGALAFTLGYGLFWLVVAGVLVRVREWP
jgi:hypothetical protein